MQSLAKIHEISINQQLTVLTKIQAVLKNVPLTDLVGLCEEVSSRATSSMEDLAESLHPSKLSRADVLLLMELQFTLLGMWTYLQFASTQKDEKNDHD